METKRSWRLTIRSLKNVLMIAIAFIAAVGFLGGGKVVANAEEPTDIEYVDVDVWEPV